MLHTHTQSLGIICLSVGHKTDRGKKLEQKYMVPICMSQMTSHIISRMSHNLTFCGLYLIRTFHILTDTNGAAGRLVILKFFKSKSMGKYYSLGPIM
jgi:hypothetical protein